MEQEEKSSLLIAADNLYSGGRVIPESLLCDDIHSLVTNQEKEIMEQLHDFASELLLLALSDSPKSGTALRLLCQVHIESPILLSCMKDATFVRCMSGVSSSNLSDRMIAKMAELTQAAFEASIKDAILSCWYLNSFLQYLDNPYVYELFASILKKKDEHLHDWIASYRLVNDFRLVIESMDYKTDFGSLYDSPELQKLYHCFLLVYLGLSNETLTDLFRTREMLATLTSASVQKPPAALDGARFRAIREFCCPEYITCIGNFIQSAIRVIERFPNGPAQDVVQAYRLITKAIDNSELISKAVFLTCLYEITLAIMTVHHRVSILVGAIRVFITHSITNEILCPKILEFYKDFLMNECRVRCYGDLAATCWYIMSFIAHEQQTNEMIKREVNKCPVLTVFLKTELKEYRKKLTYDYGGDLPMQ